MSAAPSLPSRAPARGFVLVGVVMMVMALTIIGISLYSLSGYESQFFGRSLFDRQALYSASGGIELAKRFLSTRSGSPLEYRLSNVTRAIGREGIVSAVAWQDNPPDSTGTIDWADSITIRVGVQVNGETRTVQARFMGSTLTNPYHNLVTCPGVVADLNGQPQNRPTILVGKVWQTNHPPAGSGWTQYLDDDTNISFVDGDAPEPAVTAFLSAHAPEDSAVVTRDATTMTITMDAGSEPGAARHFSCVTDLLTPTTELLPYFDFYSQHIVKVRVRGTAVWLVPRGARFEGDFIVERIGASPATLVMVVGPNGRYVPGTPFNPTEDRSHYGPWFEKGVKIASENTCLFVVSQGTAQFKRSWDAGEEFVANGISVFAHRIEFEGPDYEEDRERKDQRLEYPAWMESIANSLVSRGLLPSWVGVSTGQWTLQAGSWTTSPGLQ